MPKQTRAERGFHLGTTEVPHSFTGTPVLAD
jgi:hypothetical protein